MPHGAVTSPRKLDSENSRGKSVVGKPLQRVVDQAPTVSDAGDMPCRPVEWPGNAIPRRLATWVALEWKVHTGLIKMLLTAYTLYSLNVKCDRLVVSRSLRAVSESAYYPI